MTPLPIPVHVGSEPPSVWDDIEARQREYGEEASSWLQEKRRPAVASQELDWVSLGAEPRWVGFETADCVAALQPSIFSGQGADEFDRFSQGTQSRGELAIVISPIGQLGGGDQVRRSIFSSSDDSIHLGRLESSISSRPLGVGARAHVADDLTDADTQLALRLLSCNPPLPWRALSLDGVTWEAHNGTIHHPAKGALEPIIVTELDEPVVAAWVSPDGVERRYVVPIETPWTVLLRWLVEQCLPEYVPGAMARARRHLATDDALMTRRERAARAADAEVEAEYAARRAEADTELEAARAAASSTRDALLYGTGPQLADAVREVLEWAGITVVDLDDHLGGTKNADLLCSYDGRSRLVEVKSASGSAPERAYQDLLRHLREWHDLPGSTPVDGGALVINHEVRSVPNERSSQPYTRPEFLASQKEPVIPTLALFAAWRDEDAGAIRQFLFGAVQAHTSVPEPAEASTSTENAARKRSWLRRRLRPTNQSPYNRRGQ